jgi:hypothetical protein
MPDETVPSKVYTSAFFCDRLLREHDGILSAIRVVDLFSVQIPEEMARPFTPRLETRLVIIFRAAIPAKFVATIRATDPSGRAQESKFNIALTGVAGMYVYTAAIDLFINGALEGTNWYDILIDGILSNRLPLHIRHVKVPTSQELKQTWKSPGTGLHN